MKRTTEAYIVHHADFMAYLPFKNPKNMKLRTDLRSHSCLPQTNDAAQKKRSPPQWRAGPPRLEYKQLSQDAVYQAKRFLLDSVGCALGGYQQHDVKIALDVLDEIAARGPATVIGTGKRVDAVSASLANALMIRCMDYNDIYWKQDPSHPSDIFPAAMAACERKKSMARN